MTIDFEPSDLHDIAILMRLAQKQCEWTFYSLAQNGMRRTRDAQAVDNALCGAMHYAELFERMYKEAAK